MPNNQDIPAWLHATETPTGVTYNVDENTSENSRTATIKAIQEESNQMVVYTITQEGVSKEPISTEWEYVFLVTPAEIKFASGVRAIPLNITSYRKNLQNPFQEEELYVDVQNLPSWVQWDWYNKEVVVDANTTTSDRQASILLKQEISGKVFSVVVKQEIEEKPVEPVVWEYIFEVSPVYQKTSPAGLDRYPLKVVSYRKNKNTPFQQEDLSYSISGLPSWIKFDTIRNEFVFDYKLIIEPERTSAITVTQGGESAISRIVTFVQQSVPYIPGETESRFYTGNLMPNFFSFDLNGGNSPEVTVKSIVYESKGVESEFLPVEFRLQPSEEWIVPATSDWTTPKKKSKSEMDSPDYDGQPIKDSVNTFRCLSNPGGDRYGTISLEQIQKDSSGNDTIVVMGTYSVFQYGSSTSYIFEISPVIEVFESNPERRLLSKTVSTKKTGQSPLENVPYSFTNSGATWLTPSDKNVEVALNSAGYRTANAIYTQSESNKQVIVEVRQMPVRPIRTSPEIQPTPTEPPISDTTPTYENYNPLLSSEDIRYIFTVTPVSTVFTAKDTEFKHVFITSYKEEPDKDAPTDTCCNVEKMLLRPKYSKPCLTPIAISNGGSLRMGMYEYAIAACDKYGNEFTPHYSMTPPVSIFNYKDIVMSQAETSDNTNMGVLLQIEWEDPRVNYYKIVVAQTVGNAGSVVYYEEGVHPISDKVVTHDTNLNKIPITIQRIHRIPMVYERTRMLTSSNGYLFEGGITVKKAMNLQPVALLMGAFSLWQTVKAKEDLYQDGVNVSNYKSVFRNETYPYGIRFSTKSGTLSDTYVLASKPARASDLELVSGKNVDSIRSSENSCIINNRLYRYQFENTAKKLIDYNTSDSNNVAIGNTTISLNTECSVESHEVGEFSYWESGVKYPDNGELFDASWLSISEEDLPDIPYVKNSFKEFFVEDVSGGAFTLNSNTDFRNKGIRHYKYPDFNVSPFMEVTDSPNKTSEFKDSYIYPIGFYISEEVVKSFLKIALKNGLLTQEEYDDIDGFEVLRGDRSLQKSVVAKGLLYDTLKYQDIDKQEILFPNYPYNDLGEDKLHYISKDSKEFIKHPFNKSGNNRFTFHSPETHFNSPQLPDEMVVEAYQYGQSRGVFNQVQDHSKWVILTNQANTYAQMLAIAEVTFEVIGKYGEYLMQMSLTMPVATTGASSMTGTYTSPTIGGTANSVSMPLPIFLSGVGTGFTTPTGMGTSIAGQVMAGAAALGSIGSRYSELKTHWIKIFKDVGDPINFAYYYTSVGHYNRAIKNLDNNTITDSYLRYLNAAKYVTGGMARIRETLNDTPVRFNAVDRESFVYLSTGSYNVNYLSKVQSFDNSRITAGEVTYFGSNDKEVTRSILSPYVTLQLYNPNQYATVNSIKWLPTGHCGIFGRKQHHRVFGGDVYISRFAIKRKVPFYTVNAMNLASRTPFNYMLYNNIGKNVYDVSYDITDIKDLGSGGFGGIVLDLIGVTAPSPNQYSVYNFDTYNESGNYVKDYSKFYLFYYGIPSFLVESEINCNYRYAGRTLVEGFYPQISDYADWTQEKNVSIREDNRYFYNRVYSKTNWLANGAMLPDTYQKELYDCMFDMPNGTIYSMQDTSEQNLVDPWMVFRPLDFYQFPSSFGRLIRLKGIESSQVVGLFENQAVLYNAIDELKDRLAPQQQELGTGGIFATRPIEFFKSDLGYGGTQHSTLLSTPFGHYYMDAKRGSVTKIGQNGKGMESITSTKSRWFKKHLPFKILKGGIKNLTDLDMDNSFNNLGIAMAWDNKYNRIVLTKLDYTVTKNYFGKLEYNEGKFYVTETMEEVTLDNRNVFKNASFTISYDAQQQGWTSYHSYTPNYYVSSVESYLGGYNPKNENAGKYPAIWEHNKTEQSFGVFQGNLYPFAIEFVTKNTFSNMELSSVQYWMDVRRYKDENNYAGLTKVNFDTAVIYNETENSGVLRLVTEKPNNRKQYLDYPRMVAETMEILATDREKEWSFNSLYNRIRRDNANISQNVVDVNEIDSIPNPAIIDRSNRMKDRLRGNYFKVRLTYNKSPYKVITNWFRDTFQD